MSRHQKKPSGDKSVEGKSLRPDKEKTSNSGSQLLRKPLSATNGLPTILLTSGPNITEIKSQIIIFCQQRGIGKIAKCLDSGYFETKEVLGIDNALLGAEADPHNFQRDAYMEDRKAINEDFRIYQKSKEQLVGIIKSMTDKSLDDKLTTTFQQQQAEVDKTIAEMQARPVSAANTAEMNVFISANRIDTVCYRIDFKSGPTLFLLLQLKPLEIKELIRIQQFDNYLTCVKDKMKIWEITYSASIMPRTPTPFLD